MVDYYPAYMVNTLAEKVHDAMDGPLGNEDEARSLALTVLDCLACNVDWTLALLVIARRREREAARRKELGLESR